MKLVWDSHCSVVVNTLVDSPSVGGSLLTLCLFVSLSKTL